MKNIIKKVVANVIMAITMIAIGFMIATALYSAGVHLNVPKITIEYSNTEYDLQLNTTADSKLPATGDGSLAAK